MPIFAILWRLALVGALAVVSIYPTQALARAADLTKTINCAGVPDGVATTTLTIDLERFSLPAQWSDAGSQYEISTHYGLEIFPSAGSKAIICQSGGNWGTRDYDMYNAWTGDRWNYLLELRIVINNFPVQGNATLYIAMREEDDFLSGGDEALDLSPEPGSSRLEIKIYPSSERAFFLRSGGAEIQDSTHMMVFGRSKRFIGDGSGLEGGDVIASIDITISAANIPQVGGAIPTPGDKSPNLPSPGEPVLDKEQICRSYALQAVEWNQIAQQLQCPGFNPPVWSNNHQMHFDWCMQDNNVSTTAFHNNQRAWAIQTCRGN